jgi:hypothetical protein
MRHVIRQRFDLRLSHAVANLPLESNLAGQRLAARLEHTNGTGVLGSDQPSTDVKRGSAENFSLFDHGQLGGAAADINIQNTTLSLGGKGDSAGAVRRKQGLEVMARAGTNEIAALRGE